MGEEEWEWESQSRTGGGGEGGEEDDDEEEEPGERNPAQSKARSERGNRSRLGVSRSLAAHMPREGCAPAARRRGPAARSRTRETAGRGEWEEGEEGEGEEPAEEEAAE